MSLQQQARDLSTSPEDHGDKKRDMASEVESTVKKSSPWSAVLLILPALLLVVVYFLYPAIRLFWTSLTSPEPGVENYIEIFTSEVIASILLRTLGMAVVVTITSILIAYPFAYLMNIVRPFWGRVLFVVVLVPLWTSLLARTFSWVVILQENGPLERILDFFGLSGFTLIGTTAGVTIAMAQVMLPFAVLPILSSMRAVDNGLVPAALSLGARPLVAFFRVYLPQTYSGVTGGATLVMVLSLGFYVTPSLVGSPQNSMLAQYIRVYVNELADFGFAGALAVVLLVVTFVLLGVLRFVTRESSTQVIANRG